MKKQLNKLARGISLALIATSLCAGIGLQSNKTKSNAAVKTTAKQDLVIATMKDMSSFKWKPLNDVYFYGKKYAKNTIFLGVPYNQNYDDRKYDFAVKCGFKWDSSFGGYIYSSTNGNAGNDCSSAVAIALRSVNSSIKYQNISTDNFKNCTKNGSYSGEGLSLKTVGGYKTNSNYTDKYSLATATTYYKQLKPGDVLLYRYDNGSLHKHVVLVVEVGDGYVKITDQIGRSSGDTNSSWRHEKKMTYQNLYDKHYLPIRESSVNP